MSKLKKLTSEALSYFERKDENSAWVLQKDCPEWIVDMVFHAHNDMMPDDWRYEFIVEVLEYLEYAEEADLEDHPRFDHSPYNSDLLNWLSSHSRRLTYVDDAVQDYGYGNSIAQTIGYGQIKEKEEVFHLVVDFLKERSDEIEEEMKDDDE